MNKKFANTKKFRANKKLKQKNSRRISKQKIIINKNHKVKGK